MPTPLTDSTLFRAPDFVIHDPPGWAGRTIVKRLRGVDVDDRHVIVGDGRPLGLVREGRRRWSEILYRSLLEVVDPDGAVLLELLTTGRSVTVRDAERRRFGELRRHPVRPGPTPPRVYLRAGPTDEVVATLAERSIYTRFGVPGVSRLVDGSGREVAEVTSAGDFRHVVHVSPEVGDPLRTLAIAFACSFVDRRWLYITSSHPR